MSNSINNEEHPNYGPIPPIPQSGISGYNPSPEAKEHIDDMNIRLALSILEKRMRSTPEMVADSPDTVSNYLKLKLAEKEAEVFSVMFLDNRHRLICYREMFYGTIDGASVYPREVVKAVLQHNAAAIIIAHNHPSGVPEPSSADERITEKLKDACALVEIRLLDHVIVGGMDTISLASRGLL